MVAFSFMHDGEIFQNCISVHCVHSAGDNDEARTAKPIWYQMILLCDV